MIETLTDSILKELGLSDIIVEVELLNRQDMTELNERTRGINTETDVLSFPNIEVKAGQELRLPDYPMEIEDGKLFLGSIALCMPVIEEHAEEYGHSVKRELAYMLTHGILHLLGYDHINGADGEIMRAREEEVLTALNISRG